MAESSFPGLGQGRSPQRWRDLLRAGRVPWAVGAEPDVDRVLAALPDQDRPRPEPVYRLVAFTAGRLR